MGFSKVIPLGSVGQLSINEDGGVGSVVLSVGGSIGGGSIAGVLKGKASVEVDANAKDLIDAGLLLCEAKFPAAASIIGVLKAAIDAEMEKV